MLPPSTDCIPYRRRTESLAGQALLEAKMARAVPGLVLAEGPWIGSLPPELRLPPAAPPRRRLSPGRILRAVGKGLLLAQLGYILATSLLIAVYRFSDPSVTVLMAYRSWGFGWKLAPPRPVALRKVPSYVRRMLVSVEDYKFYEHHGLDFEAFERAYEINSRIKRPLYGGSTLTMQVARTLFLVPEKSYLRKYLEVIAALELELLLPKDRILELYFGYAEWGKGVFGVEAASRAYYGKSLSRLSREEAARLVALLSSPIKYKPSTLAKNGILRSRYEFLSKRYLEN